MAAITGVSNTNATISRENIISQLSEASRELAERFSLSSEPASHTSIKYNAKLTINEAMTARTMDVGLMDVWGGCCFFILIL